MIEPEVPKEKIYCALCLVGPPASGKGTLASRILPALGGTIITPGNIYRVLREEQTPLGEQVREVLKDGGYCPDWLTNEIVLRESQRAIVEGASGVGLDGYPRSLEQLAFLQMHYDVGLYVHLESPYDTLMDAAINRRECSTCHQVFNLLHLATTQCVCQRNDDAPSTSRWDDTINFYAKRYQTYLAITEPIVRAIRDLPNYVRWDSLSASEDQREAFEMRLLARLGHGGIIPRD